MICNYCSLWKLFKNLSKKYC